MSNWWSNDRIAATVTESYVCKKFHSRRQQEALRASTAFGDNLTNDTYLDWILERSPRLFLILDDIKCIDHIFESVDRSFTDDDLPLDDQALSDLRLPGANGKKFAKRQHAFLVKELVEGVHVNYADDDIIPVQHLPRKQAGIQLGANVDKVQVGDKQLLKRRMSLDQESGIEKIHFILHFKSLQKLKHPHLTSVWATYAHKEDGYILLQPSSEMSLRSFMDDPPKHFRSLAKSEQRDIIVRWIQCLASALAFLHENGYAHRAVRPSNVYVDSRYGIFLGAYSALGALEDRDAVFEKEAYNHGAPEQWQKKAAYADTNPLRSTLQSGGRTGRRVKPPRSSTISPNENSVALPESPEQSRAPSRSSEHPDPLGGHSLSSRLSTFSNASATPTSYSNSSTSSNEQRTKRRQRAIISTLTYSNPNPLRDEDSTFFPADVFALCTIITSLLSLLAATTKSGKSLSPSHLPSHLAKRNQRAGRGGAPADHSWHANLLQVDVWLKMLDESVNDKPASKFPRLGRKDKGDGDGDSESWRWKGFLGTMTDLMRYGFQKDVKVRWTAVSGVRKIRKAVEKWGLGVARCCEDSEGALEPPSHQPLIRRESVIKRQEIGSRNRKQTIRSPVMAPRPVSVIPEDFPPPGCPDPGIPELSADRMSAFSGSMGKLKIHSPGLPELPASEADVNSPKIDVVSTPPSDDQYGSEREQFVSPITPAHQGKWDFDFPKQPTATAHPRHPYHHYHSGSGGGGGDDDDDDDLVGEYEDFEPNYEDNVAEDVEAFIASGLHNAYYPASPSSIHYQFRKLPPPPPLQPARSTSQPHLARPKTSSLASTPARNHSPRAGSVV